MHTGTDGTLYGVMANSVLPIYTLLNTGARRKYAYLHAAVYAGFCKPSPGKCPECEEECPGHHYVIENGGYFHRNENEEQVGMVRVCELEEAFEAEARFYIFSPPRDENNKRSAGLLISDKFLTGLFLTGFFLSRIVPL